jgi:hypothetical protein
VNGIPDGTGVYTLYGLLDVNSLDIFDSTYLGGATAGTMALLGDGIIVSPTITADVVGSLTENPVQQGVPLACPINIVNRGWYVIGMYWVMDWDFTYDLYGATPDNKGTDVHTPGFLWPLEHIVRDAVGPKGKCIAEEKANRENPRVAFDWPFVTGTSVESSIAYGKKIVEVLATLK